MMSDNRGCTNGPIVRHTSDAIMYTPLLRFWVINKCKRLRTRRTTGPDLFWVFLFLFIHVLFTFFIRYCTPKLYRCQPRRGEPEWWLVECTREHWGYRIRGRGSVENNGNVFVRDPSQMNMLCSFYTLQLVSNSY